MAVLWVILWVEKAGQTAVDWGWLQRAEMTERLLRRMRCGFWGGFILLGCPEGRLCGRSACGELPSWLGEWLAAGTTKMDLWASNSVGSEEQPRAGWRECLLVDCWDSLVACWADHSVVLMAAQWVPHLAATKAGLSETHLAESSAASTRADW